MKANSIKHSFIYAVRGFFHVVCTQRNMRIHLAAAAGVYAFAWYYNFTAFEYAVLTLTVGAVWIAEAFNTAIEAMVDLASPEVHPLARIAKDTAAGAVLISAIMSAVIGWLLFWPRIRG